MWKKKIVPTVRSERRVSGGRRVVVDLRVSNEVIPGVLLLPEAPGPVPAVLLLHGFSSRKEHLSESVGSALLARGVASLSIDLPLHGDRSDLAQAQAARNPLAIVRLWRSALEESRLALRHLESLAEVDATRLAVAGYSLGSFLAVMVASEDPGVRAVVLAAGGDLPAELPLAPMARTLADPLRAVRRLAGRPLLMVHGRSDRTVRPDQAERLFAAAGEPKELRWWDAGHILPPAAMHEAADWLAGRLGPAAEAVSSRPGAPASRHPRTSR